MQNKQFQVRHAVMIVLILGCNLFQPAAWAGDVSAISDDFTQGTNSNNWKVLGSSCLTAGTAANNVTTGTNANSTIPGCNLASPDDAGKGALRLTSAEKTQRGSILSNYTFPLDRGLQITFTTYVWGGPFSSNKAMLGGDGMSFFLMDGNEPTEFTIDGNKVPNIGSHGGSLGYSCHNYGDDTNGMVGGYLGLGMDEYGNFLNGGRNLTILGNVAPLDNSADGVQYDPSASDWGDWPSFQSNRIGLRGAGSIHWYRLNAEHPNYYPTRLNQTQRLAAVANTCSTGNLWDYSDPSSPKETNNPVYAYRTIPGGYKILPPNKPIATPLDGWHHQTSMTRDQAKPVTYKLLITSSGYLSLTYKYDQDAYESVLTNFNINSGNAPLPDKFRFGFSSSTGDAVNNHEITCFVAEPAQSSSGASANTVQGGQVRTGTQIFLPSYSPTFWNGTVVAKPIVSDANGLSAGTATWDANCTLVGGVCLSTGTSLPTVANPSDNRVLLTWNNGAKPLRWDSLNDAQKSLLGGTDATLQAANGAAVLDWLRGGHSQEQTATPPGTLRARVGVLGDIVDSSPTWVGPPSNNYGSNFQDNLYPNATAPETSYVDFVSANAQRTHMLYVGANDGFLHAFRAGANNADGNYVSATNDGKELFAYMPATVLSDSRIFNFAQPTYGHEYFADATPGTGDIFDGTAWRTWLTSGMGPGGKEVFVLDITNPDTFANKVVNGVVVKDEDTAKMIVKYDWTDQSLNDCIGYRGHCGDSMGYSYGTPLIRRLHNGKWAVIFGNGGGSKSGKAGVFVAVIETGTDPTMYWLETNAGTVASPNGIYYVTSNDIDGDHVTDYLYAGDLLGNVWRFDLTSNDPTRWAASTYGTDIPTPLFKTNNGQPITTQIANSVIYLSSTLGQRQVIGFGTGKKNPFTSSSASTYATGTQSMYGIWDWDMSAWNTLSNVTLKALTPAEMAAIPINTPLVSSNLLANALDSSTQSTRNLIRSNVCWQGGNSCTSNNNQFGWKFNFPANNEQIIYNPKFQNGILNVNTTIPAVTAGPSACSQPLPKGWSMGFDMASGGGTVQNIYADNTGAFVVANGSSSINGIMLNAVGTPYIIAVGSQQYLVNNTVTGDASLWRINLQGGVTVKRLTWEQVR